MELFVNGAFHIVSKQMKSNESRGISVFKGILERFFLVVGLLCGYPQVIVAFGALKIGTRFQKDNKVTNDYFLIGNFISLIAALLFTLLIIKVFHLI